MWPKLIVSAEKWNTLLTPAAMSAAVSSWFAACLGAEKNQPTQEPRTIYHTSS